MKLKNKLIFLLIGLLSIVPITDVNAKNECDNTAYACATCKYNITSKNGTNYGSITYVVKSDGTKVTKEVLTNFKSELYAVKDENLSSVNFISDKTNKIKCPESIEVGIYPSNRNTYFDFYLNKCDSSKSQYYACSKLNLTDKTNNNKTISNINDDIISCKYETSIINGQASNEKITGVITVNDGKIDYEFTKGYKINTNINEITPDMFTKNSCPELYFSCGSSGNAKYCSYQLENAIRPGTEQEGDKNETADDLENDQENADESKEENNVGFMNDIDKKYVICNGTQIPYGVPYIVHNIVNFIKVGIPIVLIILGMVDFLKAVIASDEKQMKDAQTTFIRRLIASVIIFFVFAIIQFIFSLVDEGALGCVNCIINKECGPVEMYGDAE